jgi:uncharacterized protein YutE (UPF0331/DUF86 family)
MPPPPDIPLNRELLEALIGYIEESLKSLERFKRVSSEIFLSNPDNFRIAFYDLHRALEAVMDIGSHILSRIPGGRPASYKDIPRLLERNRIIPSPFAGGKMIKMAGYRNRMVHFYGNINPDELFRIIQDDLEDFYTFISFIVAVLKDPGRFSLSL